MGYMDTTVCGIVCGNINILVVVLYIVWKFRWETVADK